MSVKIPVTRVKKSQPAVSPVTTIFYPGDWNVLRTHLASSFIILLVTCTDAKPLGSYETKTMVSELLAVSTNRKADASQLHDVTDVPPAIAKLPAHLAMIEY